MTGVGASLLALGGVNHASFSKMGQSIALLNANSFLYTGLGIADMFVITLLPINRKFAKTDLITIIERR